jgi:hypothetical protein
MKQQRVDKQVLTCEESIFLTHKGLFYRSKITKDKRLMGFNMLERKYL